MTRLLQPFILVVTALLAAGYAYLAARLYRHAWQRWITMFIAAIVIVAISVSRLYLGVHYPSDVLAGAVVGLAWAAFCMATLEAIQKFSQRNSNEVPPGKQPEPVDL